MDREEFERVVLEALRDLPQEIRDRIRNLAVIVEDLPPKELIGEMGLGSPYELMGLYQGISVDKRGYGYGNVLPDRIVLFRLSIERTCRDDQDLRRRIYEVLYHEIGHYMGLGEDRLREMIP